MYLVDFQELSSIHLDVSIHQKEYGQF